MSSNQNLILASEDFTAAVWVPTVNSSVSSNVLANPLDGAMTADKIVENGAVGEHGLSAFSGLYVCTGGQYYCLSIYAKADTRANITLNIGGGTAAGYNLTAGTVTGVQAAITPIVLFAADMVPLAGGWYRCFYVFKCNVTTAVSYRFRMSNVATYFGAPQSYAGDGVSGLYVYGAQVVQANWPGPYVATVAAQVNPTDPIRNMAPSSQNLHIYSEQIDNAAWTKSSSSVTPNAIANPLDGVVSADALLEVAAVAAHYVAQTVTPRIFGPRTESWYVRGNGRTQCWISLGDNVAGNAEALFDLTAVTATVQVVTGVVGAWTNLSARIETLSAGWFRISLTATQGVGTNMTCFLGLYNAAVSYLGDITKGIYVFGAQLVQANYPGPYQPTGALAYNLGPIRNLVPTVQNLLSYSSDFTLVGVWPDIGAWTIVPNDAANPVNGAMTASKFTSNTGTNFTRSITAVNGPMTFRVWVKPGTATQCGLRIRNITTATDLASRSMVLGVGVSTTAYGYCQITALAGGWYVVEAFVTSGYRPTDSILLYLVTAATVIGSDFWLYEPSQVGANWPGPLCHTDATPVNTGPIRNLA